MRDLRTYGNTAYAYSDKGIRYRAMAHQGKWVLMAMLEDGYHVASKQLYNSPLDALSIIDEL